MRSTTLRKKISFLSFTLGSLIVTSLGTGKTEAALPVFSCPLQCNLSSVTKSAAGTGTLLNKCAEKCDNRKIMDVLLAKDNYQKLNSSNLENFQNAVMNFQAEKNILKNQKQQEFDTINAQIKDENTKSKPSKTKLNSLQKKQEKLKSDIKDIDDEIGQLDQRRSVDAVIRSGEPR